jgi:hypothetical protein
MTHSFLRAGVVLALASLAGCAATSPSWDNSFGGAVRASVVAQTVNPAASANRNPVAGIDAQAALGAQQQYERSFAQPAAHQPAMVSGSGR